MRTKAIIFDMDGVLSDTQKLHAQTESRVLALYGIHLTPEEITEQFAGTSDEFMFGSLMKQHNITAPLQTSIQRKWAFWEGISPVTEAIQRKWDVIENTSPAAFRAMAGALDLLKRLQQAEFRMGLASSSPRHFIQFIVKLLKMAPFFRAMASTEEVRYSKPHPEVFLLTAQKLNVFPSDCLVIEDSFYGLEAAKRAGMMAIGLVDKKDERVQIADWTVESLSEITLEKLEELLGISRLKLGH